MRSIIHAVFTLVAGAASGQTVVSVADGPWNDPATWDCACVPSVQSVVVMHDVELTTNIIFFNTQVQVTVGASLFMTAPHSVAVTEVLIAEGAMYLIGDVDVDGVLDISGFTQVIGTFHNDADLLMGMAGAALHVEGDLHNEGTIDGTGNICVTGFTMNEGGIAGDIDFCDGTPTTAVPPIIDVNTGTVEPSVTFCATSVCVAGVADAYAWSSPRVVPNPARERILITGLPADVTFFELIDMAGGNVLYERTSMSEQVVLDLARVRAGPYALVIHGPRWHRACRLVVER